MALRYVRAFGGRGGHGEGSWTLRNQFVAAAAETPAEPVGEDEAREMLSDRVRRGGSTGTWFTEHFVLLLEAMVGTEVVLDALTTALEGEVGTDEEVMQLAFVLGFLLLRVPAEVAKRQRARLQAVLEKAKETEYLREGLALALGGGKAALSMGKNPSFYHHAADDPPAVREAVAAGEWLPSARHVFIGGEPVLETLTSCWKRHRDTELQRKLAEQLAPIASPLAVRILAEMATKSKVKKKVPKICAPYAAPMKPHLEALTHHETAGEGAKAILA